MASNNPPKAIRRHEKIARSKKQEVKELQAKVGMKQSALRHYKEGRAEEAKKLPKNQQAAFKTETIQEIAKRKESITATKAEYKAKKADLKADRKTTKQGLETITKEQVRSEHSEKKG